MQADTTGTSASTSAFSEFLSYELFNLGKFEFTVLNIILISSVVLGTLIFAKVTSNVLRRYFKRSKWIDDDHKKSLLKLTRATIVFIGLALFLESLAVNHELKLFKQVMEFELISINNFTVSVYNIFLLCLIYFIARLIVSVSRLVMSNTLRKKEWVDEGKEYTLTTLLRYVIYTLAVLMALQSLGFNLTLLLTSSAALFVGLGLGLQDFFGDIVSGFVLLFEGTVKKGDLVEIDDLVCKVKQINIRTSKVMTRDGNVIIIPNRRLTSENVNNWSYSDKYTRFKVEVGVAYGSDTQLVKKLLIEAASEHKDVAKSKEVVVRFDSFGDSSLDFELLFWAAKTWEIDDILSDIRFNVDLKFRENNIEIPFPQRSLHIVSDSRKNPSS